MKPIPMFPVAPPLRDDVDQAPIAQQVEAAPGEVELDAAVRAQSSAPQVVERLTTLEDCLWAAVEALGKLPVKARKILGADVIIERAKFLLRGDLEVPEGKQHESREQDARAEADQLGMELKLSCSEARCHGESDRSSLLGGVKLVDLRLAALPEAQRSLWQALGQTPRTFVLYGGTAMALRLGHRQSEDFDFFSNDTFEPSSLLKDLGYLRDARVDQRGDNTLTVIVDRNGPVKLSFFGDVRMGRVRDPDIAPGNGLQVASLLDLTATKLKAIQQRAEAKDYLDLAAALDAGIKLSEALGAARAVYGKVFNAMAALKALTYFEDGNLPRLPPQVKRLLLTAAKTVTLESIALVEAKPGIAIGGAE